MTKISRIVAMASTLSVMGLAVVPVATYALNTEVQVDIQPDCSFTGGSATVLIKGGGTPADLSPTNPYGETAGSAMSVICNDAWSVSEQINTGHDVFLAQAVYSAGDPVIAAWSGGGTPNAFTANSWGAKYASAKVVTGKDAYHAVPANGSATDIASDSSVANSVTITPTYGAKIDSLLPSGLYLTQVLYTLTH
ncbi:MAG: hypothetical protein LBU20_02640 [Candidatus Nomurabacteria bacterium]|jgi:hypothetical protein|nr:hypothetical protein [Candidatus Nomurabacteria bacterium]